MRERTLLAAIALGACLWIPASLAARQASGGAKPAATPKPAPAATKTWSAPKTPWGDPDLQGTWTSDDTWGVPFERPAQYGNRRYLTEDELTARENGVKQIQERMLSANNTAPSPARAQAEAVAAGKELPPSPAGAFGRGVDAAPVPGHWGEFARRASKQTSQVVDPPNGRIPSLTPEAQEKLTAKNQLRRGRIESWENWSYYDRCITRGVAGSTIPVIYGNGLEIVQSPGFVAIRYEMVHDHRIIPVSSTSHAGSNVRSYMGDSIGHWEGNTLVVETTNFIGDKLAIGANGDGGAPYSDALKLVERFTRTASDSIDYEVTVNDPKTYTSPWTVAFPITKEPGYELFEYACHEGNHSIANALSATRAEKAAEKAAKKK
jgi:hypothetical protein